MGDVISGLGLGFLASVTEAWAPTPIFWLKCLVNTKLYKSF